MSWPSWFAAVRARLGDVRRVHFRVDAGRLPGLSFGHLERCLVFADLLRQTGAECRFFMRPIPEGVDRARARGQDVTTLDGAWAGDFSRADLLVLDLPYAPEPETVEACARAGARAFLIDDSGRDLFPCEAVLDYSVLARPDMYPRARHRFLGPSYLMVDQAFHELALNAARGDGTIVVTLGGSDPTELTRKIVPVILARNLLESRVVAVLGPGFGPGEDLEAMARDSRGRLEVRRAPDALLPLLAASSAVVCAGGKTLYECLGLGRTVLAVASTGQEAEVIAAFLERGDLAAGLTAWDERLFAQSFNHVLRMIAHDA